MTSVGSRNFIHWGQLNTIKEKILLQLFSTRFYFRKAFHYIFIGYHTKCKSITIRKMDFFLFR